MDKIDCTIGRNLQNPFSFYIIPTKHRVNASVSVELEFNGSGKTVMLHTWDFTVAGHKFESSKVGLTQSEQNQQPKRYYLFFPGEKQKVFPSNFEQDLDLIDSLFLLKSEKHTKQTPTTEANNSSSSEEETPTVSSAMAPFPSEPVPSPSYPSSQSSPSDPESDSPLSSPVSSP